MNRNLHMTRNLLILAALLAAAPFLLAQDTITAGSTYAEAGASISVPVSIRDASSTPLGVNLIPSKKIQAIAFKITASPASAVTAVDFEPAGVLQGVTPLYERIVDGSDSAGYIGSFSMDTAQIPFNLGAALPGDRIGSLLVTLAPGLPAETKITLTFDLLLTALGNQTGTILENAYNRKLQLTGGAITIGGIATTTALTSSLNPSVQGNNVTFTATVTPAGTGTVLFRDGGDLLGTVTVDGSGVAALTTGALTAGTHSIQAFYEATGSNRSSASAVLVQTVNAPPVTPPVSIVATATSATTVMVSWPAVANAVSYEISRRSNGGAFEVAGSSSNTSFIDGGRLPNTTYLYVVRAVATGGSKSLPSPSDTATTVVFTDDPVTPAVTRIKRAHVNELRTAINAYRATAGLAPAVFTDPTLTTSTVVKRVHFEELRAALDAARSAYGLPPLAYTDASLVGLKVKAVHLQELRAAVK